MSTSLTDTDEYRTFCAKAATDRATFQTFRRADEYEHIVRVNAEHGQRYLAKLKLHEQPVEAASTVGDPRMYPFPGYSVPLDPVMIRYYFDRQEIWRYHGPTFGRRILEIGGGFGGLAHLLYGHCVAYAIRDLPEPRMLQDAYLAVYGDRVADADPAATYDLVVSTFAYSELKPEVQYEYAADYLREIPRGYMVCNFLTDSLTPDELLNLIPGGRFEEENPRTHEANRVLVWGDK